MEVRAAHVIHLLAVEIVSQFPGDVVEAIA
jgi:hypothetical protein